MHEEGTIMGSVSITELKAHLAEYLRRVQDGERFHITSRGREIADLVPADPVRAALWRMVEDGEASWSGGKPVVPRDLPVNTGPLLSDIVLEDRGPYWDDPEPDAK
ncbi:MAG: type II toxin-antitoxin system prevent-host-death family antitoxin [Actinobacteria bacterium]|nr:type II toxin-antitoxin system prevent-host-death family antitoxin [Actinomycetota bacterium]